jgi:hypothetical protein
MGNKYERIMGGKCVNGRMGAQDEDIVACRPIASQ